MCAARTSVAGCRSTSLWSAPSRKRSRRYSHLRDGRDAEHLDRMTAHYRRTRRRLDALAPITADRGPLHPQLVAAAIDRLAADDAVFFPTSARRRCGPPAICA